MGRNLWHTQKETSAEALRNFSDDILMSQIIRRSSGSGGSEDVMLRILNLVRLSSARVPLGHGEHETCGQSDGYTGAHYNSHPLPPGGELSEAFPSLAMLIERY